MRIKRFGISQEVTQEEFDRVFKKMGYEIDEKVQKQEEKEMTKADIINELVARGIEHNPRLRKDELKVLLDAH
jgi:hypothetical protein